MIFGLDTNILCYILDPAYPEHEKVKDLLFTLSSESRAALNPTIIHEAYHTLVLSQKWTPREAERRLKLILRHPYVEFYSQTKRACNVALTIAVRYGLGGRDSLITANFLVNKVPVLYTHDQELLELGRVAWGSFQLAFKDPTT